MSYLQALSVFCAVAEEGSFTAAAKRLGLTQPTVSFHIDNLEKNFGCPLFMRTAKGVELTVYGQTLYENSRRVNAILEEAQNQIKALVAGTSGHIPVGASTIPGEYILPGLTAAFLRRHPGVKVSITTGDSQAILAAYASGQFPIAIVGTKPDDPAAQPLWQDELVLVVHPDLLAEIRLPDLAAMTHLPLILRKAPSGSRQTLLAALAANGIAVDRLNVVLEVTGNAAIKQAVLQQAGAGFLSRWAVQDEVAAGRLAIVNVPGLRITRTFYGLCNPSLMPTTVSHYWQALVTSADPSADSADLPPAQRQLD
ncbi:LysR family transcriptional regulator [Sporolituus thermophilus]|uniref:DNA-binding transcriptional regulator, LysR family n=1 Tax=Sporolituus thermophilus DSM 23256 TaxID=1123285 RepID=A0A1G7PK34_9FIRM|nr:LysR family transcriptional regulator [Sporolituus thermophilus]SDF86601.1 DNA-binding transcriptional regulator, LysR family [Sporolituus thermophilus DSM 23256]